jgi:hypothetical protein
VKRHARLRDALKPRDAALLAVPALLFAVYALPRPLRLSARFVYREPTVADAFLAHYVHLAPGHLLFNAVGYLLAAPVSLCLCALAGERRLFYAAAAAYLGWFPVALSALNLAVPRGAVGYGFSGVVMAFVGFAPVAVCAYAGGRRGVSRGAPALFFLSLVPIAALAVPDPSLAGGLAGTAGLLVGAYGVSLRRSGWLPGRRDFRALLARRGHAELVAVGAALPLLYPFVAFTPRAGTTVPNLYAHLLGYCLGFVAAYVFVHVERPDGTFIRSG